MENVISGLLIAGVATVMGILIGVGWTKWYMETRLRYAARERRHFEIDTQHFYILPFVDYSVLRMREAFALKCIKEKQEHREFLDRFNNS